MQPWSAEFPGIFIDARALDERTGLAARLGSRESRAFVAATRQALARIAGGPVGRDLLTLISKRCRGIGSGRIPKTCRILFGKGTVHDRHGRVSPDRYVRTAGQRTGATADVDYRQPQDAVTLMLQSQYRVTRLAGERPLPKAGPGLPALVSFDPFISYDVPIPFINYDVLRPTDIGGRFPAFVVLAHELVHALHTLSGDWIKHDDPRKQALIEEARTVGAGKYANTRISENAIRREHGLPLRTFYDEPGDCDAAALA